MADRRADESPLAPHRSLSGPTSPAAGQADGRADGRADGQADGQADGTVATNGEGRKPSLSERVSAAVTGSDSATQQSATPASSWRDSDSAPNGRQSGTASRGAAAGSSGLPSDSQTRTSSASRAGAPAPRPRGTRRARLRLVHVDPWSIMKTSFLLSIAFGIVTVVAVAVVWSVLGAAGTWESINRTVTDVLGSQSSTHFDVRNYVGTSRVLGFTMIVAVVDVVLITAISTLGAFLYNLAAALLGGLEVTLAEDER